jgi:hypothetical protein
VLAGGRMLDIICYSEENVPKGEEKKLLSGCIFKGND